MIAGGILVGLLLIGTLVKSSIFQTLSGSMFVKEGEIDMIRQEYGNQVNQVMTQLKQARFDVLWKDFVKFVLLAVASLGIVYFFVKKKLSPALLSGAVLVLLLIDLLIVVNKGGYISPKPSSQLEAQFQPDATVTYLKQQPGLFRVFPLGNLFTDNTFAYHGLQSIGGYSPAKLKIYQTLLDSCLYQSADPSFPINMNIEHAEHGVSDRAGRLPREITLMNVDEAKRILHRNNSVSCAFFVMKQPLQQPLKYSQG
jgi:hypothetical protein